MLRKGSSKRQRGALLDDVIDGRSLNCRQRELFLVVGQQLLQPAGGEVNVFFGRVLGGGAPSSALSEPTESVSCLE